ncbi:MAG: helix-turn-helix transcriptional regulator [Chlamydiota bacterium]
MRITAKQLRAARAMLGLSQVEFANRSGTAKQTIVKVESDTETVKQGTLDKIISTYELEGIEFTAHGVEEKNNITILHDHEGFSMFLDDVYETSLRFGTSESPTPVYLCNVVHANWIKWMGPEKWEAHTKRMIQDQDVMDVRIIVREGDYDFPAQAYSQYKWVKEEQFNERSFYSYHDKLAFLSFREDSAKITVMRQADFAESFQTLFLNTWNHVAVDPKRSLDVR